MSDKYITLPAPMTDPEADLRDRPYMPLFGRRLLDSDLFNLTTGDEFKAAVKLWILAFYQSPPGSLPDNDRILANLSGAGPQWEQLKEMVLHGWVKCSDGRLYHPVVAESVSVAWEAKKKHIEVNEKARGRMRSFRQRQREGSETEGSEPESLDVAGANQDSGVSQTLRERSALEVEVEVEVEEKGKKKGDQSPPPPLAGGAPQGAVDGKSPRNSPAPKPKPVSKRELSAREVQQAILALRPEWLPESAWIAFIQHRKAINKKLTVDGARLVIGKLDSFRPLGQDPVLVIEQSIERGWTGVFELKQTAMVAKGSAPYGPYGLNRQEALEQRNKHTALKAAELIKQREGVGREERPVTGEVDRDQ